jgi:ribonuclease J
VVTVIVCVDADRRDLLAGPEVATRGWVGHDDVESLKKRIVERVRTNVVAALSEGDPVETAALEKVIRRAAGSMVNELTRRRPMIGPVVVQA